MKNLKIVTVFLIAFILNGCGGPDKMRETADLIKYTATPQVLVEQGNEVKSSVVVLFPEKYFNKKATAEIKLVLVWDGGEKEIATTTVQGESVEANNTPIRFETGGSVTLEGTVPFESGMRKSELKVRMTATIKDATVSLPDAIVAQGVLATSKLVEKNPRALAMNDNFQRVIPSEKEAEILFLINKADIRGTELKKEEIKSLVDFIVSAKENERKEFKGAKISAYASPDGEVDLNTKLAGNRETTAKNYLSKEFKKAKIEQASDAKFIASENVPEDWDGFKKLMGQSNIKDKDLILRVLSMYSDPVVREKEIKNISEAFEEIKDDVLPKLRRSVLKITVEQVGYSDDELKALVDENIDTLNIEELLFAANLYNDFNKKVTIYQKATEKYPGCIRAFNNLGYSYINLGNVADAKAALDKAAGIKADNATVLNNLGVVALLEGDAEKAEQLFISATDAGNAVQYNLGIINIMKGKYEAAVQYLGGTDSFNQALALALTGKNNPAAATCDKVENKTANVFYLKAVLGARSQNEATLFDNLRTAVQMDASLKEYAKKDMEFGKYFENETFTSIVG